MGRKPARKIAVGKYVGLAEIRRLLTQLGIVYRRTSSGPSAMFRPAEGARSIFIDVGTIEVVTAEALSILDALVDWLGIAGRSTDTAGVAVHTSDSEWLRNYLGVRQRTSIQVLESRVVLPTLKVRLLNLNFANVDYPKALEAITKSVSSAVNEIRKELAPLRFKSQYVLDDWATEFLAEALLNVAQHAELRADLPEVCAYISASYLTTADIKKLLASQPLTGSETAELEWAARIGGKAPGCLDISVSDIGVGVPESLAAMQSKIAEAGATEDALGNVADVSDDYFLIWALSAFGTRKTKADFSRPHDGVTWRGLYRLLRRCTSYDGLIRLTSAAGESGCVMSSDGERSSITGTSKRPPSPVTTIRAVIPVTARNLSTQIRSRNGHDLPVIDEVAGIISLRPEEHSHLLDSKLIEPYCAKLRITIETRLSQVADDKNKPWIILHQISRIARVAEQTHGLKFPDQVDSELISGLFQRILVSSLFPTQRFIHCFFPGTESPDVQEVVREYLVQYGREIHPYFAGTRMGVVGIGHAGGSRVRWIHSHPAPDPKARDSVGVRLWNRLIAYQPEAASSSSAVESKLSRAIAREIASQYLSNQIRIFRAAGLGARTNAWFWESDVNSQGNALQCVRTRSGRLSTQYLSVLGFCNEHPTFLAGLADRFADALIGWSKTSGGSRTPMVVIADTDSSGFLLNKLRPHIEKAISSRGRLEWFIAGCVSDAISTELWQRSVVFGDFRFEGTSIRKKFEEIKVFLDVAELLCGHIFVAVDQQREGDCLDPNSDCTKWIEVHAFFREGKVIPLAVKVRELSVDPVTNDLISPEQTVQASLLCDVYWREDEVDELKDIAESTFRHGVERIGGRYSTVRWPVAQNLREAWCVALIAGRLRAFMAPVEEHESVCFCYRADSSLKGTIADIVKQITEHGWSELGKPEPNLWLAEIGSHVFHGRQYFGNSVQQAITLARPAQNSRGGDRQDFRQLRLNLDQFPDTEIERPEFSHYVYIDNSAVTGKSIAEFLLAIRTLPDYGIAAPKRVLLFPIVTRLSPAEEELLRCTQIVSVSGDGTRSHGIAVAVQFCSLLQMRMRTYTHPSTMPLAVELRKLVQDAKQETDRGLNQISESISAVLRVLNSPPSTQRETILAGSVFGFPSPNEKQALGLSMACVKFRQLIGLLQQGVPCTREITITLSSIREARDPGLVNVLAMEPDLLSGDPLFSEIIPELRDYAVVIAVEGHSSIERTNAIWVLSHMPFGMALLIRNAIVELYKDDLASKVFVYLALYHLERPEFEQLCRRIRAARAGIDDKGWMATSGVNLLFASQVQIAAANRVPIEGLSDAKALVVNYLVNGRDDHIAPLTVEWMKIVTKLGVEKRAGGGANLRKELDGFESTAENWISRISVPAQRAVEYIVRSIDQYLSAEVATDRESAFRKMEVMKRAVDAYRRQLGALSAVDDAWRNLLKSVIWKSSDYLYNGLHAIGEAADAREDAARRSLNNSSSHALLLIANSPIFILLSRMRHALSHGVNVVTSYSGPFGAMVESFSSTQLIDDLPNSLFLRSLWFQACIFPGIWGRDIAEFDKVCRVLCDNLGNYANPGAEIEVDFSLQQDSQRAILWVRISSLKRKEHTHGKGSGLVTVANICKKHGWLFEPDAPGKSGAYYVSRTGISVELIELGTQSISIKDLQ